MSRETDPAMRLAEEYRSTSGAAALVDMARQLIACRSDHAALQARLDEALLESKMLGRVSAKSIVTAEAARDAALSQVAALRVAALKASSVIRAYMGDRGTHPHDSTIADAFRHLDPAIADTEAAALAHDERVRAEERGRIRRWFTDRDYPVSWCATVDDLDKCYAALGAEVSGESR